MTDEEFYSWINNKKNVFLDIRTINNTKNFVEEIKAKYDIDLDKCAEDYYEEEHSRGDFEKYIHEFKNSFPFLKLTSSIIVNPLDHSEKWLKPKIESFNIYKNGTRIIRLKSKEEDIFDI